MRSTQPSAPKTAFWIIVALVLWGGPIFGQSLVNPVTGIRWSQTSGSGAPSGSTCPYTATGTLAIGTKNVTAIVPTSLFAGLAVTGTGIPANTTLVGVNVGASTATLSQNATTSGAQSLSFYPLGQPYVDVAGGTNWFCTQAGWKAQAGTAANPAGASGQVQYNAGGVFGAYASGVPIAYGGTGATTAAGALANLGAVSAAGAAGTVQTSNGSGGLAAVPANVDSQGRLTLNGTSLPSGAPAGSVAFTCDYSPNKPLNAMCFGAKGDGTTDDTAALNAWFNYGYVQAHRRLYLATPSNCYKVTSSLLFGGFGGTMEIDGDGHGIPNDGTASPICYTTSLTGPVINNVSHGNLIINGISIIPLNGTLTGNSDGSCFYSHPDSVGGGNFHIYNSFLECGASAGTNAVAGIGQDLAGVYSSALQSLGNGVVIGNAQGPNTTTQSSYTQGSGYGVTHVVLSGNMIGSTYAPVELTGSFGDYVISNSGAENYEAMINAGDNTKGIIDLSYGCTMAEGGALNLDGVNIENQSSATGVPSIYTGSCHIDGGVWTGRIMSDIAGPVLSGKAYGIHGTFIAYSILLGSGSWLDNSTIFAAGPTILYTGSAPAISGSTITGSFGTTTAMILAQAAGIGPEQQFSLCAYNNLGLCVTVGTGPYGSGGYAAEIVQGFIDMSNGGHIVWQDRGNATLTSGVKTVNLAGTYVEDPDCGFQWTGSGTLTGQVKVTYNLGASPQTVTFTSSVLTDTAVLHYSCKGV